MEIVLNLNSAENSLDLIKYCTLYFDKLKIDSPIDIDSIETLSDIPDGDGRYFSRINFTPYIRPCLENKSCTKRKIYVNFAYGNDTI